MIFFIDLDRTVFNAHLFINDLVKDALNEQAFSLSNFPKYVYSDALIFLTKQKTTKNKLVLVTRGDPAVQKTKAQYSGVSDFFSDALYVSSGSKASPIGEYVQHKKLENEEMYFIDDTIFELNDVRNTHSNIHVVRMRRPDAKNLHQESPDIVSIANFDELETILK